MARSDRPKASEVFRNSNFVFSSKASLEEVYPEIEEINVRAVESDYGRERSAYWNRGQFVDCSNPTCYNGGFDVGSCIHKMVRSRTPEGTFAGLCRGFEGSPKGRVKHRACMHAFEVIIEIKYYSSDSDSEVEIPVTEMPEETSS